MEIRGTGATRHFTPDEEATLRADASTTSVMQAKTKVAVRGDDVTYRAEKEHQQSVGEALTLGTAVELGMAAKDGLGLLGVEALHGAFALSAEVASPIIALGLGVRGILEAHEKGERRADALAKDTAHVALLGALDLPDAYKAARLDHDLVGVSRGFGSPAFKMTETICADPKARALLQLHADRGMRAARDVLSVGGDPAAALARDPKLAASYKSDAAFKEGFDAYRFASQQMPVEGRKALDAQLDARDGWYAQAQVQVRI